MWVARHAMISARYPHTARNSLNEAAEEMGRLGLLQCVLVSKPELYSVDVAI